MQLAETVRSSDPAWSVQDEVSDEQLIEQIASGSHHALEIFYDRYASTVMGLAYKMLGDQATAEEVVQETFWRLWRHAETFQAKQSKASSWLFSIARNLCIDTWRRRKVRPQPHPTADGERHTLNKPDPGADVMESAWTKIKRTHIRQAMNDLPPPQRQVIEMAYFWGLTRQEIAERTDTPLGTVHTRARLALKKLRQTLQEQGFEA